MHIFINILISAKDGDQLVDFYWIDPMFAAERIAAKSKYPGKLYLQYEPLDRSDVNVHGILRPDQVPYAAYMYHTYICTICLIYTICYTKL